jgi:HEAT repeat protein
VRQLLVEDSVPTTARLDLLRALGSRAGRFMPEAGRALERLASHGQEFRIRYLLLEPAAALAPTSLAARTFVSNAMTRDTSEHVRAQAARVVERPELFRQELLKALEDPGVRVREAAVSVLNQGQFGVDALLERLSDDAWPLVRSAAADSLAAAGPNPKIDDGYCVALAKDASPMVRVAAVRAVGTRGTTRCLKTIREQLEDSEEVPEVRVAAADALGLLCDRGSVQVLTRYAERAPDRMLEPTMRRISMASIRALGRIHPADLSARLGRLRHDKTPPPVRQEVDRALSMPAQCKPGKPRAR